MSYVDEKDDRENDNSLDACLNIELMLRNLGEVHILVFNDNAKIGANNTSNVYFPMSINVRSISINKITKNKHCAVCSFEWRKVHAKYLFALIMVYLYKQRLVTIHKDIPI